MKFLDNVRDYIGDNKSGIAIGVGLGFSLIGAIFTARAAIKSKEKIDQEKKLKDIPEEEKLPVKDVVKVCWKDWIPAVLSYGFSFAAILKGKSIDNKNLAAASVAYELLDSFSREYTSQVKEKLGEEEEKKIRDNATKAKKVPEGVIGASEDYALWDGDSYFWEPYFGKLLISNTLKLQDAVNEFNDNLNDVDDGLPVNDLYDMIWKRTPISLNKRLQSEIGDDLGYSKSKGLLQLNFDETMDYYLNDGRMIRIPILRFESKRTGQELIPTLYGIFS